VLSFGAKNVDQQVQQILEEEKKGKVPTSKNLQ